MAEKTLTKGDLEQTFKGFEKRQDKKLKTLEERVDSRTGTIPNIANIGDSFLLFHGFAGHGDEDDRDDVGRFDLSRALNNLFQFLRISSHWDDHPASLF